MLFAQSSGRDETAYAVALSRFETGEAICDPL
jgi:hypothetical protein